MRSDAGREPLCCRRTALNEVVDGLLRSASASGDQMVCALNEALSRPLVRDALAGTERLERRDETLLVVRCEHVVGALE